MDVLEKEQLSADLASEHWYYQSKFRLLGRTIARLPLDSAHSQLADFGCGVGLFLKMVEKSGIWPAERMCGIDSAYPASTQLADSKIVIHPSFRAGSQFDLILLMDVLEHITEDRAALGEAVERCRPGGFLFITVPAFQALWSKHDDFLGHRRRYTVSSLGRLLRSCPDLEIVDLHYYYAAIFPLAAAVRLVRRWFGSEGRSDMRPAGALLNGALQTILRWELSFARCNRLAGLSVTAVCRKRAGAPPA